MAKIKRNRLKMFVFISEKLFASIERYTDVSNIETIKDLSNNFERKHLFQKVSNSMLVSFYTCTYFRSGTLYTIYKLPNCWIDKNEKAG